MTTAQIRKEIENLKLMKTTEYFGGCGRFPLDENIRNLEKQLEIEQEIEDYIDIEKDYTNNTFFTKLMESCRV